MSDGADEVCISVPVSDVVTSRILFAFSVIYSRLTLPCVCNIACTVELQEIAFVTRWFVIYRVWNSWSPFEEVQRFSDHPVLLR